MILEAMSDLHINMLKSVIYPLNMVPDLEELVIMCCNVGCFPSTYLDLPLSAKHKSAEIWNRVVENFEKRLTTWQKQYLSLGGRINSVCLFFPSLPKS